MALRDVTLGQFFPGNSLMHKLDPRTKILMVTAYIVALFGAKYFLTYGLMLFLLCQGIMVSKVPLKAIFKGMKPLVMIVFFTAALNLIFGTGEIVVWEFFIITLYWEAILMAFFMSVRILMLVTGTFLLTYTTSPMILTGGLEYLMKPLERFRVPVHDLSMMMSIALRFIPNLIEETDKIMSAQKARGADFESGSFVRRAKAMIPLLVPLFISALRRADELAEAMDSRCYHGGEGRTKMTELSYGKVDLLVLGYVALLSVIVLILGRCGL